MKLSKDIAYGKKEGDNLVLSDEKLGFYDVLTKPRKIKDFYENDQLISITRELTETLKKNNTTDWLKKESTRARMKILKKKLLRKYNYPPKGMNDAIITVMTQCEY